MPEINDLILQRLKVAARVELSPQMAHDVELRSMVEYMTQKLILELRSTVYAHRVGNDETMIPFEKTVRISGGHTLAPRLWLPHAIGAVVAAIVAVVAVSVLFAVAAAAFALLAFANRKPAVATYEGEDVTVRGEVKVEANYFNTFPDNTVVYPDTLGGAVRLTQLHSDVRYFDPRNDHTDDLRGDADR